MSDLPTPEEAQFFVDNYQDIVGPVDIGPKFQADSAISIVAAYASGRLIYKQPLADAWKRHKPDMDIDGQTTLRSGEQLADLLDALEGSSE